MRRPMTGLALAILALAGCSRTGARQAEPQHDEIRSAHGQHIGAGMTCLECHESIVPPEDGEASAPSKSAGARGRPHLPTEAECKACHVERPEEQQCGFCHTRPEIAGTYPQRDGEVIFDHGVHVTRASGLCVRCHGMLGGSDVSVTSYQPRRLPPMSTCTNACHTHTKHMRGMECSRCHRNLHRYGLAEVAIVRHRPGFVRLHGTAARVDRDLCGQCHDATHCADCHQATPGLSPEAIEPTRVGFDFVHRGDFISRHPIEARVTQITCTRCHGIEFCDGCHRESGVGGSVAPGSRHGPGWLTPLSPRGHSREARRDIMSCVACHESNAEQTCVPCHRVGGPAALNPHPPGFGGGLDPSRNGVCLACHEEWP